MQQIALYRYARSDGGVTVSTVKPETEYTELTRLVAEKGHILTDGENYTICTDTEDISAWSEVEDSTTDGTEAEKAAAYDILMGETA